MACSESGTFAYISSIPIRRRRYCASVAVAVGCPQLSGHVMEDACPSCGACSGGHGLCPWTRESRTWRFAGVSGNFFCLLAKRAQLDAPDRAPRSALVETDFSTVIWGEPARLDFSNVLAGTVLEQWCGERPLPPQCDIQAEVDRTLLPRRRSRGCLYDSSS
jgi:hypothetical protein